MSKQALKEMLVSMQAEKKTGKVIVFGKEGNFSRIGNLIIDKGELRNARFPDMSGNEALKAILTLDISQVRFLEFPESQESPYADIWPISKLLAALNEPENPQETIDAAKQKISEEQQAILLNILSAAIGPIARVIGPSVLASATHVDQAIELMASEIPDQDQAAKFISEARRRLKS